MHLKVALAFRGEFACNTKRLGGLLVLKESANKIETGLVVLRANSLKVRNCLRGRTLSQKQHPEIVVCFAIRGIEPQHGSELHYSKIGLPLGNVDVAKIVASL